MITQVTRASRLQVAMISDVYFPRINGVSTSIETFRTAMRQHGVDVRLLVPDYDGQSNDPAIIRVPARKVPFDPEDRIASWKAMHQAARALARTSDLIHIQTPFVAHYAGIAAARATGLPVVATYHTLFEEYLHHYLPIVPKYLTRSLARVMSRTQCNALDGLIVPSSAMCDRLKQYGVHTSMTVLPTGIPTQHFEQGDGHRFRQTLSISDSTPLLLFVGRVAHEKNIGFLLQVMKHVKLQHPLARLVITGEGPALQALKADAERLQLGESVIFIGYLDRSRELVDAYAAATAFVFASRTETQGLVLLEAMAAGAPVIALSEMGTADILRSGQGCIVPADTVEAFADAVIGLLSDQERRTRLSEQAVAYASQWSDQALAARLADFYRSLRPRSA